MTRKTTNISRKSAGISMLSLLFLTFSGGAARAAESSVAGYVEWFEGPAENYEIRSTEPNKPVELFMPVHVGDRIIVRDRENRLRLNHGADGVVTIGAQDSPYTVPDVGKPPTPLGNLARKVLGDISHILTPWKSEQAVSLAAREGEQGGILDLALLDHAALQIVGSDRNFTVAWRGGAPPFEFKLFRTGEVRPVLALDGVLERALPSSRVAFEPGRYRAEVKDAKRQKVSGTFEAVNAAALPKPPAQVRFDALPPEIGKTAYATWLAGLDNGVWALESFLQVSDLAKTYEPARTLAEGLVIGETPVGDEVAAPTR